MRALDFMRGVVAAFYDEAAEIRTRDRIMSAVRHRDAAMNGFDFTFDHLIRRWRLP